MPNKLFAALDCEFLQMIVPQYGPHVVVYFVPGDQTHANAAAQWKWKTQIISFALNLCSAAAN